MLRQSPQSGISMVCREISRVLKLPGHGIDHPVTDGNNDFPRWLSGLRNITCHWSMGCRWMITTTAPVSCPAGRNTRSWAFRVDTSLALDNLLHTPFTEICWLTASWLAINLWGTAIVDTDKMPTPFWWTQADWASEEEHDALVNMPFCSRPVFEIC